MKTKLERAFLREMSMRPGEGMAHLLTEYTTDDGWKVLTTLLRQAARKGKMGRFERLRMLVALAILPTKGARISTARFEKR